MSLTSTATARLESRLFLPATTAAAAAAAASGLSLSLSLSVPRQRQRRRHQPTEAAALLPDRSGQAAPEDVGEGEGKRADQPGRYYPGARSERSPRPPPHPVSSLTDF